MILVSLVSHIVLLWKKSLHQVFLIFSEIQYQEGKDVITKILTDVYCLNAQNVKKIANSFAKHFVAIGRREKALIKHYLDYRDSESFSSLMTVLSDYMITEPQLSLIFESAMCDLS